MCQNLSSLYANGTSTLQTDRQTDGRTTYDSNTALALRASRGKNYLRIVNVTHLNVRTGMSITVLNALNHTIPHRILFSGFAVNYDKYIKTKRQRPLIKMRNIYEVSKIVIKAEKIKKKMTDI